MNYKIKVEKKAQKFIDKQDKIQQKRIYKAIYHLPNGDTKRVQTKDELYRLRVGEIRFIYKIIDDEILIKVIDADSRGDVYKKYK